MVETCRVSHLAPFQCPFRLRWYSLEKTFRRALEWARRWEEEKGQKEAKKKKAAESSLG